MLSPLIFVQLVLFFVLGMAGTSSPNTHAVIVDKASEAVQVRQTVDQLFNAAKKRDWDAAAAVMSTDFELYTDGASGFSKDAYVKVLREDNVQLASMELRDMEIRVSGDGQMAWAKYRGLFKFAGDQPGTMETVETLVFKREAEQWKIAHAHVSLKPLAP